MWDPSKVNTLMRICIQGNVELLQALPTFLCFADFNRPFMFSKPPLTSHMQRRRGGWREDGQPRTKQGQETRYKLEKQHDSQ